MNAAVSARERFLKEYRHIRHAEGRGSDNSDYYRGLPFSDQSGQNSAMWAMRAKSYQYLERKILRPLESRLKRPLDILDLGAGNCWLSYRVSLRGHNPVALDIFSDSRDGLRAASHYPVKFPTIEADFDQLPFPSNRFDLAIFNASFHYSADYVRTLSEVKRSLRPHGAVVVVDSPIYKTREHGMLMVEEKHAEFLKRYGFASDSLPSIEFLDLSMLGLLRETLGLDWQIFKPWYGFRWHLRPVLAWLRKRRPPSRFWILSGRFRTV